MFRNLASSATLVYPRGMAGLREHLKGLVTPQRTEPIKVNPKSHPLNVFIGTFLVAHALGQTTAEKVILTSQPFVMSAAATYGAHQGVKKRPQGR